MTLSAEVSFEHEKGLAGAEKFLTFAPERPPKGPVPEGVNSNPVNSRPVVGHATVTH